MELVKITHYVKESFEDKPSFVLLMSDDKEYISNGCVFVENTEDNIAELIEEFDCESFIIELLIANPIETTQLIDGRYMFDGCDTITDINNDFSNITDGRSMFCGCKNLINVTSNFQNVVDGRFMFCGCLQLKTVPEFPSVVNKRFMFSRCRDLLR